ncbi:hypothetical protein CFI09_26505 (plasmid) [Escherichia coli]|nr:hypothetical protein CFI09_26505 [Escherichia coli]
MHCVAHNLKQLRSLFTRKFHPFSSTQVAEEPGWIPPVTTAARLPSVSRVSRWLMPWIIIRGAE